MILKKRLIKRKNCNDLVFQGTTNAVKCSSGRSESLPHRITKFWLANFCWDNGLHFVTEATFKGGGRADFIVKDWCVGFEILASESIGSFIKKVYPIPIIPLRACISPIELKFMLDDLLMIDGDDNGYYSKKFFG